MLKSPVLPRVWAGFRRSDAAKLYGDGPELAAVCRRRGRSAQQVLESAIAHEVQLTCYAYLFRHVAQRAENAVEIRSLIKTKTPMPTLASSPRQIKTLWSKVADLLGDEQTQLQRDALAIEPVEE